MILLLPFGKIFHALVRLRNSLYDRGLLKSHALGRRTISVGNVTTGGTGKTPLVAMLADRLIEAGERVCILSRGYGRETGSRVLVSDGENVLVDAAAGGDEPVELARRLRGKAVVISDADRIAAARWALERFDISAFLLDDGFQHRKVWRDLDIVCVDATDTRAVLRPLPAGRLREPFSNIRRADIVVVTRFDPANVEPAAGIQKNFPETDIFVCETWLAALVDLRDHLTQEMPNTTNEVIKAYAFCGLGNPAQFFGMLKKGGVELLGKRAFPDHHRYTPQDLRAVEDAARTAGASALITTAKDAAKLSPDDLQMRCLVALPNLSISDPDRFYQRVLA